jgi:molybdopterin synthase sulfur carrier subunit
MTVLVRVYARYAEVFGGATVAVEVPPPVTVATLVERLRAHPGGQVLPARPLVAVNLAHARPSDPVGPDDEVALLPPLSGG